MTRRRLRFVEPDRFSKDDPFHPALRSHEIHRLLARAKHTIYSAVMEGDLGVLFRIDGERVTSLDVGSHRLYRG